MLRAKYLLLLSVALLGALAFALSSCGGGGDGEQPGPPFIRAELNSFPPGGAPPGFTSNALVGVFSNGNAIANASVTMNGVPLAYNATDEGYEGNVVVAPGGAVSLSVTLGGNTYTASATQFTSYPTISAPAAGAFDQTVANAVTWSSGAPIVNATEYVLGVLDAGNPNAPLVWPENRFLKQIPLATTSFSIPPTSVNGGDRLLIAGISVDRAIPNAASGSVLSVAGFNYVPITVNGMHVTNHPVANGLLVGSVVWSGTQFVAVGGFGTILTSPDGSTWTTRRSGTQEFFGRITWSGTQFVVVGLQSPGNGVILTSPDAISWTPRNPGTTSPLFGVTWSGTQFVATGFSTIVTSPDGVTWTPRNPGVFGSINRVACSGTTCAAVGNVGILTSPDGAVWTPQSGASGILGDVTWSGTLFVAVGDGGSVLTSPDGVTWTPRTSVPSASLRGVVWTGTEFVAVGGSGSTAAIATSPDGVIWTPQATGPSNPLGGVAASGTAIVMVGTGNGANILTSP